METQQTWAGHSLVTLEKATKRLYSVSVYDSTVGDYVVKRMTTDRAEAESLYQSLIECRYYWWQQGVA